MVRIRVTGMAASAALVAAFTVAGSAPAAAASGYTCSGGSPFAPTVLPAGTYASLTVTGFCTPAAGTVTVQKNVTIAPGGAFGSMDASSIVTIAGNVDVQAHGLLALGCGPSFDTPCPEGAAAVSSDTIGGNLSADRATLLIMHFDTIGGNVAVSGGGGGLSCAPLPGVGPPYVDFASNSIGRNASISGLRTCWSGFSANSVAGNVSYQDNVTGTPDGNYVGNNSIERNLNCSGNSPAPHLSDFGPDPNTVARNATGQCASLV